MPNQVIDLQGLLTELVLGFLLALLASVGRVIRTKRAAMNRRTRLRQDLQIYQELDDSPAKKRLKTHIDHQVDALVNEPSKRIEPLGIILALFFLGGGSYVGWIGIRVDGWWFSGVLFVVAAILLLFGAVGLWQDAIPRERDESGTPIKKPEASDS